MENKKYTNIPSEKFKFVQRDSKIHDQKFDTKPIGYLRDAFNRFKKNKGSVVAGCIVIFLILFAIIGPFCFNADYQKAYATDRIMQHYQYLRPRINAFKGTGFWDGSQEVAAVEWQYYRYMGVLEETGHNPIIKQGEPYQTGDKLAGFKTKRDILVDTYYNMEVFTLTLTYNDYVALQQWQKDNNMQIILPYVDKTYVKLQNESIWYACNVNGRPTDLSGKLIDVKSADDLVSAYHTKTTNKRDDLYDSLRLEKDPYNQGDMANAWSYAQVTGGTGDKANYVVRVDPYNYFIHRYGFEPAFLFGTNQQGYDIFSRLAQGARFSLLFALAVSAINLIIGAIYGAIEGYYGGTADLVMERVSDILSAIPSMVVTVLFNLHLSSKVGIVPSLLYAFVLTGWIGMASRTRMQFYRFKNQEYVLAARTLGASDRRIMFKHIFPNSLGTLITGSILSIPGVIFSETSLTYLGIINLDSPTRSSVGAMLSAGKDVMDKYPHMVLFPALFIGLLMVSFNLFGNGLRDAFNPSLRGTED